MATVIGRHREVVVSQTKTRQRVRDLAEVYTNEREVTAMLDLIPDMFPSSERPRGIGQTFLEPACGAGNFLVAILDRKLAHIKFGGIYRSVATFETAVLKAVSSIYGIDIDQENIDQSRQFLKADVAHHMNLQLNTVPVSEDFWNAVDAILESNIIRADTLKDAQQIRFVEYHWQRKTGYVIREWTYMEEPEPQYNLFEEAADSTLREEFAIHYSALAENAEPARNRPQGGSG